MGGKYTLSTDREMASRSWTSQLTGVVEYPMGVARGGNNDVRTRENVEKLASTL